MNISSKRKMIELTLDGSSFREPGVFVIPQKGPSIYYVSKGTGWVGCAKFLCLLTFWVSGSEQMLT